MQPTGSTPPPSPPSPRKSDQSEPSSISPRGPRVSTSQETPQTSSTEGEKPKKLGFWARLLGRGKKKADAAALVRVPKPKTTREQHITHLNALVNFLLHSENIHFLNTEGVLRMVPDQNDRESASGDIPGFLATHQGSTDGEIHVLVCALVKDAFKGSLTQQERMLICLAAGLDANNLRPHLSPEDQLLLTEVEERLNREQITSSVSPSIRLVVELCRQIEQRSALNRMTHHNLAICLAPIFLPETEDSMAAQMLLMGFTNTGLRAFLEGLLQGTELAEEFAPEVPDLPAERMLRRITRSIRQSVRLPDPTPEDDESLQGAVGGAVSLRRLTISYGSEEHIYATTGGLPDVTQPLQPADDSSSGSESEEEELDEEVFDSRPRSPKPDDDSGAGAAGGAAGQAGATEHESDSTGSSSTGTQASTGAPIIVSKARRIPAPPPRADLNALAAAVSAAVSTSSSQMTPNQPIVTTASALLTPSTRLIKSPPLPPPRGGSKLTTAVTTDDASLPVSSVSTSMPPTVTSTVQAISTPISSTVIVRKKGPEPPKPPPRLVFSSADLKAGSADSGTTHSDGVTTTVTESVTVSTVTVQPVATTVSVTTPSVTVPMVRERPVVPPRRKLLGAAKPSEQSGDKEDDKK